MVFATDHDAGEKIMSHIYRTAAEAQPKMRAEALATLEAEREEKSGILSLLPPVARVINAMPRYKHEPPRERTNYRRRRGSATLSGISFQVRPSSARPPCFGVRPPHCLKKKGRSS
jgi:hypothetical protein